MDLEKIIELSKVLSKPYKVACFVLAFLLILSVLGNIYLATIESEVNISATENVSSTITQKN